LDETAIPAVSASGNRRGLRTRAGYAKIRRSQREVPVLRLATCIFVVQPSKGTEKGTVCFGIEDRDEERVHERCVF
jgi:hypothetical protein